MANVPSLAEIIENPRKTAISGPYDAPGRVPTTPMDPTYLHFAKTQPSPK